METELDNSIEFYNKYVKGKSFGDDQLQNILSDILFRYIHLWEIIKNNGEIKMIDCIKKYDKSENCEERFDKIIDKLVLPSINETNKLLLMKSIYYEERYEL